MEIKAEVVADSVSPCGARLTTMVWTYPRRIHSEIMTHRMLTKSSASSRAIPQNKMLELIEADPCLPISWGKNQRGMQQGEDVDEATAHDAVEVWLRARDSAVHYARLLQGLGLHKQIGNRLTEPFMWITVIVSATDWDNVWGLRCHPAAEPHFQDLAYKARAALESSEPRKLCGGEWHLPFVDGTDVVDLQNPDDVFKVSMARCARVSYLNHEGKRDIDSDLSLFDKLVGSDPKHAAPSEHVAQALVWPHWWIARCGSSPFATVYELRNSVVKARRARSGHTIGQRIHDLPGETHFIDEACLGDLTSGNFLGFRQFRKTLPNENIGGLMP